jgi:Uma2 family endonuclease
LKTATTRVLPGTTRDPLYPDSDGRFMGDTDFHSLAMILIRQGLEDHFANVADVYVGMNLILYFVQGDPSKRRDPDILVARGVKGKHSRRSYRVWEEGALPRTLMEIVSKSSVNQDLEEKRLEYEQYGIAEYFLFDPERKYMDAPLRGFRLVHGRFEELTPLENDGLISEELGLMLVPEGTMLRLIDLKTGQLVLTRAEQAERALEQARQARRQSRAAFRQALDERRRLEAEKQRAEAAIQSLEEEKRRADQEAQRAASLAAKVQQLQELLDKQSRAKP